MSTEIPKTNRKGCDARDRLIAKLAFKADQCEAEAERLLNALRDANMQLIHENRLSQKAERANLRLQEQLSIFRTCIENETARSA